MGKIYQVTVQEIMEDGDGVSVIELTAPVEMLRQFAPSAVAAALGTSAQEADEQGLPDRSAPTETAESGVAKERRRRRSKVEMEAARAGESTVQTAEVGGGPAPMAMDGPAAVVVAGEPVPEAKAYLPFG